MTFLKVHIFGQILMSDGRVPGVWSHNRECPLCKLSLCSSSTQQRAGYWMAAEATQQQLAESGHSGMLALMTTQGRNYIEAQGGNWILVLWPAVYGLSSISMICVQNGPLNCKNSSPECTKNRYFETKNCKNFTPPPVGRGTPPPQTPPPSAP